MLRYQNFGLGINKVPDISAGLDISGGIHVSVDVLPQTSSTSDLGSVTHRWHNIYLSGDSIDLSGTRIKRTPNGGISVTDASDNLQDGLFNNMLVSGNLDICGNVTLNGTTTTVHSNTVNVSGNIHLNDGTATNPIITFSNDTNTGVYRPGSDKLGFTTGGTTRLVIDASGNVGIGTANPSKLLDVNGNVQVSGTTSMIGNVGIGTATPQAPLHVQGQMYVSGNASFQGSVTSSGGLIGYTVGGAVTQLTSKSTGVTLNALSGEITMDDISLNGNTSVSFVLTNSYISSNDHVIVTHSQIPNGGAYLVTAWAGTGQATIWVRNVTSTTLGQAIVLKFTVLKSATA